MGFDQTNYIWFNGRIVRWDEANVHVSTHALHYGTGVFEGIRCYHTPADPAIFRLDAHLERLYASAKTYRMKIPYTKETLREACVEVVGSNDFTDCYLRPICFYGAESLGIRAVCPVDVAVIAWAWTNHYGAEAIERGVRVTISPWVKFHSKMMPTTAKASGQYLNARLAVEEATARGYDEALLLDVNGRIAEGAVENIFLVRNGTLVTNDEKSSILLGITRDSIIQLARDLGISVEIRAMELNDLVTADEAFFTGTATEVTPIRELDGQMIGTGRRGAVTERLQRAFFAATSGRDARHGDWLHHVTLAAATASKS